MTLSSILVICLGNICRSPVGEFALKKAFSEHKLSINVESAGTTSYNEGCTYDDRSIASAKKRGLNLRGFSRPLIAEDFSSFDLLLCCDGDIYRTVLKRCPSAHKHKVKLFREFDPNAKGYLDIDDPWYSNSSRAFDEVTDICIRSAENIVALIKSNSLNL
ncbi:hypothetical protein RCL1_002422 [Eukaryota sp. TZLM3-RCL]